MCSPQQIAGIGPHLRQDRTKERKPCSNIHDPRMLKENLKVTETTNHHPRTQNLALIRRRSHLCGGSQINAQKSTCSRRCGKIMHQSEKGSREGDVGLEEAEQRDCVDNLVRASDVKHITANLASCDCDRDSKGTRRIADHDRTGKN